MQKHSEYTPFLRLVFPPDSAPNGRAPVGVNPFSCSTDSLSSLENATQCNNFLLVLGYKITYLNTENTRAIFPIALILLRMTSFRRLAAVPTNPEI